MKTNINEEKKPVFDFEEYGTLSFAERVLRDAKAEYIDALRECPPAGKGVHKWQLKVTTLAVRNSRRTQAYAWASMLSDPYVM
ncbi:hypothetical protein OAF35_07455, partial [Verrucomicrobiales bacterium]|nr:hypothetical protein [Verrucomicrobiales bacterium]